MPALIAQLVIGLAEVAPAIIRAFRQGDVDKARRKAREATDRQIGIAYAKWKLAERKKKEK